MEPALRRARITAQFGEKKGWSARPASRKPSGWISLRTTARCTLARDIPVSLARANVLRKIREDRTGGGVRRDLVMG